AQSGLATTINVPPDTIAPGATFGSDTQFNLFAGAAADVGDVLHLGDSNAPVENTQLNVVGGSAWAVEAWRGNQVNVVTGSVNTANLLVSQGAMSGVSVNYWMLFSGGRLEMSGGFAGRIDTAGLTDGN